MGRGAVNQKGPESALLAAIHAYRGAGVKLPVNLVLVAEGEEEIGSPHFPQIVRQAEVAKALARCTGVFMPSAAQGPDGVVTIALGAKGVIECELTVTGEKWGRGPDKDIHSSNKARVDSPPWHLVQALHTLVGPDGNTPAIEGFAARARPISAAEKAMVAEAARRLDEAAAKKQLGVSRWIGDASWPEALEMLASRPTVNIEGLVGGYTGPGRQDGPAAQGRREARPAAGSGHDRRRCSRGAEGASFEEGVRRRRREHDGRLRPELHFGGHGDHPRAVARCTGARASIR